MTRDDQSGTVTLWLLGVCLLLFALGGMSLDLWRGFSTRRSLAAVADAAALAGASGIDEAAYRRDGSVRLDPGLAEARAREHMLRQTDRSALDEMEVDVEEEAVTVVVRGRVAFTLLGVVDRGGAFPIRVTATATPRRAG
jgi:Flp pilus assembly protein TadG